MRIRIPFRLLAVVWLTVAVPATAEVLQPTTSWDVDYGETQCTAARSFGSATFGIVPSLAGDTYKLVVSVPRAGPRFAEEMKGTVDFGHAKINTWLLHFGSKDLKQSNYQFRVSAADMENAKVATIIRLNSEGGDDFELASSQMPEILDALHRCTLDLQQYWMGEHPVGPLSTPARGDMRGVFSSDDYPSEAMKRSQGGTAQFQLLIDEKGRVAGCDVVRQSGVPVLDAMSCQVIMERAKFSPAIDAQGKPIRDVVTTPPIVWKIDKQVSPLLAPTLTGRNVSADLPPR